MGHIYRIKPHEACEVYAKYGHVLEWLYKTRQDPDGLLQLGYPYLPE